MSSKNLQNIITPKSFYRINNSEKFPSKFLSLPESPKYLTFNDANEEKKKLFESLNLEEYHKKFQKSPSFYDLHYKPFQDFAIKSTQHLSGVELRQLSISKEVSKKRLLRARVYGLSTQDCWNWDGTPFKTKDEDEHNSIEMKKKRDEMNDILRSLKLYDWANQPKDFQFPAPRYRNKKPKFRFFRMGTQECLLLLHEEYSRKKKSEETEGEEEEEEEEEEEMKNEEVKIAWLNLANAHHVCGIYSTVIGGSQEEEVATNCTGCSTLGSSVGEFYSSGIRPWVLGTHVLYQPGWHIPPGGNYFSKTKFLTGDPSYVDCFMIASAFVDLRKYIPVVHPNSEKGQYFDFWGRLKKKKKGKKGYTTYLEDRLFFDIEGCARTAIVEGVDVLVAGASGCGAFKHDPEMESRIWLDVLRKYEGYFLEVVFAVLDKEKSENVKWFRKRFGE